jgi:hypothetical protein
LQTVGWDQFFLCQRESVKKGLHWGFAEAPAALMGSAMIVLDKPGIEIGVELVDAAADLLGNATR